MNTKNIKKNISQIAYKKYQMDWIKSHGHSLDEIFEICNNAIGENSSPKDYLEEHGFDGEIYACYEEFLVSEYKDLSYMSQLLDEKEFVEYLKDNSYTTYDYFVVNENIASITEYGYMAGDSVTDNPKEICRIAECDGAECDLSFLTGDSEEIHDAVNDALEMADQRMRDVTEEQVYERIYELLSKGSKIVEGYDELFENYAFQKYICLQK